MTRQSGSQGYLGDLVIARNRDPSAKLPFSAKMRNATPGQDHQKPQTTKLNGCILSVVRIRGAHCV